MDSPDRGSFSQQADTPPSPDRPSTAVTPWQLTLFDGLRLTRRHESVPVTTRAQRLAALLALRGPQSRTLIGGMLWPEVPETRARASARAAVRDLNQQAPGLLMISTSYVRVDPAVPIDVRRFLDQARRLLHAAADPLDLAEAIERTPGGALGGSLLPGWHDAWVVAEAERLHQLRLHALEALVGQLLGRERYAVALQVALAAVALDPLRESTHRTAMQVHLAEGNTVEALRQYERFRTTLRAAMKIEPSRRMLDLVEQIRGDSASEPRLSMAATS